MGNVRAAVAGRFVLALAIGALVFLPASAQLTTHGPAVSFSEAAQVSFPIFEQYDECLGSSVPSQQFPDPGFDDAVVQPADDFNVSGSQTLSQVIALGVFNLAGQITDVTVEVYDRDGPDGLPGTLLCSEVGLVNTGAGAEIDVVLDGSCVLTSGTYWMSVMPVMSFTDFGQWFWSSNVTGYGSEFAFQDPDGLLGGACTTWALGNTDCGIGITFPNLCFGIGGAGDGGDGGTGTPAVGTTGVILMLLVVMAISFFYLRRRQTA